MAKPLQCPAPGRVAALVLALASAGSVLAQGTDARWSPGFNLVNGCSGSIDAIAAGPSGEVYYGGSFEYCGSLRVNGIVRYDPVANTLSALGSGGGRGVQGSVNALAFYNGALHVGGRFSQVNVGGPSLAAGGFARWSGSAWSVPGAVQPAPGRFFPQINALRVVGTDLLVGGDFGSVAVGAAAVVANNIARWNGVSWSTLGSGGGAGVDAEVLAIEPYGSSLMVGGQMTTANVGGTPVAARGIAQWTGTAWAGVGSAGGQGVDASVSALLAVGSTLFVGGSFIRANLGGPELVVSCCIARWNGSAWSAVGGSVGGSVEAMALYGGDVYVGGIFTNATTVGPPVDTNRIARWNGSAWSRVGGIGENGVDGAVNALAVAGDTLHVGGSFTQAALGPLRQFQANGIARWSGSAWSAVGGEAGLGIAGVVRAVVVSGNDVYVGGTFSAVGAVRANNVARFDRTARAWSALPGDSLGNGVNGDVYVLLPDGDSLLVGGAFDAANVGGAPVATRNLARWRAGTWTALAGPGGGNGVDGTVFAVHLSGADLFVGGEFTQANVGGTAIGARNIARWRPGTWFALGNGSGNGVDGRVRALASYGGALYVGGTFRQASAGATTVATERIARWSGTAWSTVGSFGGSGADGAVSALVPFDGRLFVGGAFTVVNLGRAVPARNIAVWDGTLWSLAAFDAARVPQGGTSAFVADGNEALYAFGNHALQGNPAGTPGTGSIARLAGDEWVLLPGSPFSASAGALAGNDRLFVGGPFGSVGNAGSVASAGLAEYDTRGPLSVTVRGNGRVTGAGIDCPGTCAAEPLWDRLITLFATPASGHSFTGWSSPSCGTNPQCQPRMLDALALEATFAQTTSVTGIAISDSPSVPGADVRVTATIFGTLSAPQDGRMVVQASSGESCTDDTVDGVSGTGARFSCLLRFATSGQRTLGIRYEGSATHAPAAVVGIPHGVRPLVVLQPQVLPPARFGDAYSTPIVATGAGIVPPVRYALSAGSLPAGLRLDALSGLLDGTPGAAGASMFTISATDSSSAAVGGPFAGSRTWTLDVARAAQAPLVLVATPDRIAVGATASLAASGGSGSGAIAFAIAAGAASCVLEGPTVRATATGTCTITATRAGDANFEPASATASVEVVGNAPTLVLQSSLTTLEDMPSAPVAITVGDVETPANALQLGATSSNPALVSNAALTAGLGGSGAARSLVVAPSADASGSATLQVTVTDGEGLATSRNLALQVLAVNDPPTLAVAGNIQAAPGATGAQVRAGFVSTVSVGPADEQAAQVIQGYAVDETSDPSNVVLAALLANDGRLTYVLSGLAGTANLVARAIDDGGTENGGRDTSDPAPFTISVPLASDLEVSITNADDKVVAGAVAVWELFVANAGPNAVAGARLRNVHPAGLATSWICTPVQLAACPAAQGSGSIDATLDLPANAVLRYLVSGFVSAPVGAVLSTTATIAAPPSVVELDASDNASTDSDPVVPERVFSDSFEAIDPRPISVPLPPGVRWFE